MTPGAAQTPKKLIRRAEKLLAECAVNRPRDLSDWANDSVALQLLARELLAELRRAS